MTVSWQQIPHYRVATRVDLHTCLESLAAYNAERPVASRVELESP